MPITRYSCDLPNQTDFLERAMEIESWPKSASLNEENIVSRARVHCQMFQNNLADYLSYGWPSRFGSCSTASNGDFLVHIF
jgi:hypothetical protein